MAQLSVPSSDIADSTWTPVTTLDVVGFATFWEALAEDDEATYVRALTSNLAAAGSINVGVFALEMGLQGLTDPLIDDDWIVTIIYRITLLDNPGTSCDLRAGHWLEVTLGVPGDGLVTFDFDEIDGIIVDGAWHTFTFDASAAAPTLRAGGFFGSPTVILNWVKDNTPHPTSCIAEQDWAFFQLSLPDAGPEPDIEVTGGPGLGIYGGNFPEEIDGPILGIGGEGFIASNQTVGGPSMGMSGGGLYGWNEFYAGPNLIINGSAVQVLSVDVSGLYTFIKNKRNDTLYTRNATADTLDVKIPKPFAKTFLAGG